MDKIERDKLRPHLRGYSSAALPVAGVAALGLLLASRLHMPSLTCAVIVIMPIGCLTGFRAMRYLKNRCSDSVVGFTINAALLLGLAAPTVAQWVK